MLAIITLLLSRYKLENDCELYHNTAFGQEKNKAFG